MTMIANHYSIFCYKKIHHTVGIHLANLYKWLFFCFFVLTPSAWGMTLDDLIVQTNPSHPGQGEIALITVNSNYLTPTSLLFQEKTLSFQACPPEIKPSNDNKHCYFTLIAIPINTSEGKQDLIINLSDGKHIKEIKVPLDISLKQYAEEHLSVEQKMVEFPPDILKRIKDEQAEMINVMSRETNQLHWTPWFAWPVPPNIKSPFGLRRFFNGQPRSPHAGIDLKGNIGDPVIATNNGHVVFSKDCYLNGNTIIIDHGQGLYSIYCHLSKTYVKNGDYITKNQIIGEVGKTGRATGPHLHWGISLHGTRIDPQSLMNLLGKNHPQQAQNTGRP